MPRSWKVLLPLSLVALSACADAPTLPSSSATVAIDASGLLTAEGASYVLVMNGNAIPESFSADIAAAGGAVSAMMPEIGVAVVSSSDAGFSAMASKLRGVQSVALDLVSQWANPAGATDAGEAGEPYVGDASHAIGAHESFRNIQWAPDAVSAPAAWATGALGAGARVAILDGGVHSRHVDIAPRLDAARSRNFTTSGGPANWNTDVGTFWHGTHVAGIVAAPANGIGTVGIAPAATLISVKVLHNGRGAFSWIINGIYYASTSIANGGAGAHIINMSLGAGFDRNGRDAASLLVALGRATTRASQNGVTVIAAAGNSAVDLDHTNNLVFVPAMSPHVVSVAATAPMGWALGSTDLDRPASYTNFGQSAIAFAGPGGDSALPGSAFCSKARIPIGSVTAPCWVFDLVVAPCRGGATSISSYCWAAGTSMASPAVAGVAALIVGKYGPMSPAHLIAGLRASADDLGKNGNDDYYGGGRVNALRAVQ